MVFRNKNIPDNTFSNIIVELTENENGMATLSGENNSGSIFQIVLNYDKEDVILRNTYFIDFKGDNKKELCLEINIRNSVSPDFNTILVYDVEDDKLLFPTNDKSFIYNGTITEHRYDGIMKNAIKYISYTKLNGISVEDESSVIIWGNESFQTLEYQNKLLTETDQYIVYYNKTSSKENELYKLVILNPNTLEIIQELELKMDETKITEYINNQELVKRISDESYDLYVKENGIQQWDAQLSKFK